MSIQNVKKENVHRERKKPLFMHEKNYRFFSTNWKKISNEKKKNTFPMFNFYGKFE